MDWMRCIILECILVLQSDPQTMCEIFVRLLGDVASKREIKHTVNRRAGCLHGMHERIEFSKKRLIIVIIICLLESKENHVLDMLFEVGSRIPCFGMRGGTSVDVRHADLGEQSVQS